MVCVPGLSNASLVILAHNFLCPTGFLSTRSFGLAFYTLFILLPLSWYFFHDFDDFDDAPSFAYTPGIWHLAHLWLLTSRATSPSAPRSILRRLGGRGP